MWRRTVVLLAAALAVVAPAAALHARASYKRSYLPSPQVNCVDYKMPANAKLGPGTMYKEGMRPERMIASTLMLPEATVARIFTPVVSLHEIARRFDSLFPEGDDLVQEHAKLVHDINSLRQAVFVAPFSDDVRDYDDTIFPEFIDAAPTTSPRPPTTRAPSRPTRGSFPVLLLGGASQRQPVKSPMLRLPRPTISLVGTSVSPVAKHPYPFASAPASSARKPVKICVTSMPMPAYSTTRRPSLWERILSSIIPR